LLIKIRQGECPFRFAFGYLDLGFVVGQLETVIDGSMTGFGKLFDAARLQVCFVRQRCSSQNYDIQG
jgi:hypothetical protein